MRRLILLITLCAGIVLNASAQTFTQRVQQQKAGQGTVTIHESQEIDQLVNSVILGTTATPTKPATPTSPTKSANPTKATSPTTPTTTGNDTTPEEDPVDLTKKIRSGGIKVNGYRVQAFAGGNSRKDRQQAESVGNQIKSNYPEVPVYVHFYSPRWICRVGNYRTYEEAHQMLLSLRKMGFTEAIIVKGKITVYD